MTKRSAREKKHKAVALRCERLAVTSGWKMISQKLMSHGIWSDLPEERVAPHSSADSLNVTRQPRTSPEPAFQVPTHPELLQKYLDTHLFLETRICSEVWVILFVCEGTAELKPARVILFELSWLFCGPQQLSSLIFLICS